MRPLTARTLNHIIEGEPDGKGGHSFRRKKVHQEWMVDSKHFGLDDQALARLRGKKYFPHDWTANIIQNAIPLVLQGQPESLLDRIPLSGQKRLSATVLGARVAVAGDVKASKQHGA
ncbi:hypothetical protein, partial [Propionibacterium freudenreichii]|uniref:hypothetical protein n=1 Tax=Propionibacterium freudenreichii TaxID=1744 RepID=UPI0012D84467